MSQEERCPNCRREEPGGTLCETCRDLLGALAERDQARLMVASLYAHHRFIWPPPERVPEPLWDAFIEAGRQWAALIGPGASARVLRLLEAYEAGRHPECVACGEREAPIDPMGVCLVCRTKNAGLSEEEASE